MLDAGGHFRRREVLTGRLEEVHRSLIFERRRVGHVDDDLSARKRICQAFASNRVHARVWRGCNSLVALLFQLLDDLRPD